MTLTAEVIDPVTDSRWDDLVARSPDASVFHHPLWLQLIGEQYRYPLWACCLSHQGRLTAGMAVATVKSRLSGNRLVSLPFCDHVPPLYAEPGADTATALLAAVARERESRSLPLEVHASVPALPGAAPGDRFQHHAVALGGGMDEAEGRIKAAHRRNVRRARAEGVGVERRTDRAAIEAFFRMHVLTRRRQGSPTQPKRFFLRMQRLFDEGMGFVMLAVWGGRPIAAAVYLQFEDVLTYKFGASDPAHLDKRANHLIQYESMRYGAEHGFQRLDLGRTDLDNPGLRRFKLGFGAAEEELTYSVAGRDPADASVRSMSSAQQALIRRSPPALGRLAGAALYRHFG